MDGVPAGTGVGWRGLGGGRGEEFGQWQRWQRWRISEPVLRKKERKGGMGTSSVLFSGSKGK